MPDCRRSMTLRQPRRAPTRSKMTKRKRKRDPRAEYWDPHPEELAEVGYREDGIVWLTKTPETATPEQALDEFAGDTRNTSAGASAASGTSPSIRRKADATIRPRCNSPMSLIPMATHSGRSQLLTTTVRRASGRSPKRRSATRGVRTPLRPVWCGRTAGPPLPRFDSKRFAILQPWYRAAPRRSYRDRFARPCDY